MEDARSFQRAAYLFRAASGGDAPTAGYQEMIFEMHQTLDYKLSFRRSEFDRHEVANHHCRNEILRDVFVPFGRVGCELSTHDAEQAFAIRIEHAGS